ncbi:MAG: hypothetical protein WKF37_16740 [Bryobacteraceae bacterium]
MPDFCQLRPIAVRARFTARLPFFQGDTQTMRFVSTYSLQEAGRGFPGAELQVIPGNAELAYDLS